MTNQEKSSTGMDLNVAGLLCYLLGFITGIIFLVLEKESSFVKFHALQSIFISVFLMVINIFLSFIPLLWLYLYFILTPIYLIIWILMMVMAYQGKRFKFPLIGDIVEKQLQSSK